MNISRLALNDREQTIVKTVARVVANSGPTCVTVIGRIDRVGTAPANMALAEGRADTVRGALITVRV